VTLGAREAHRRRRVALSYPLEAHIQTGNLLNYGAELLGDSAAIERSKLEAERARLLERLAEVEEALARVVG
jgi:hypothetical protein